MPVTPAVNRLTSPLGAAKRQVINTIQAGRQLGTRCIACGQPVRAWHDQVNIRGDVAHRGCVLYQAGARRSRQPADARGPVT